VRFPLRRPRRLRREREREREREGGGGSGKVPREKERRKVKKRKESYTSRAIFPRKAGETAAPRRRQRGEYPLATGRAGLPRRGGASIVFSRNANRKSITADVVRANNLALKLDSPENGVRRRVALKEPPEGEERAAAAAAFNATFNFTIEQTVRTLSALPTRAPRDRALDAHSSARARQTRRNISNLFNCTAARRILNTLFACNSFNYRCSSRGVNDTA